MSPMTYGDSRGLPVTASGSKSVELLDASIASYLGARTDAADRTAAALAQENELVLALCLKGYLLMHSARPAAVAQAKETLENAERAACQRAVSKREALHVSALRAWIEGDLTGAVQRLQAVLSDYPLDILALRLTQFLTSYLGDSLGIRDCVARVLPAWDKHMPGYGFVLGCYAYGLEEAGEYATAERIGREAVDLNRADIWAAHAVAHVMEMEARPREGIRWVHQLQHQWDGCNNFARHISWHECLFHLTLKEFDRVLDLYDRAVRAESTDEYLDIANAAALLWRLEQARVDIGHRWEELSEQSARRIHDHLFVLADLHYMLALAAVPNPSSSESFLNSCAQFADSGTATQAQVMKDVGLPLAKTILAHRRGDYATATDLLFPVRHRICRVGGSHAQRDVFEQLLIDSCLHCHRTDTAQILLSERKNRRPHDVWISNDLSALFGTRERSKADWQQGLMNEQS